MKLTNAHQGRLAQVAGKAEPTTRPINAFQARLGMIAGDDNVTAVNPPANGYQAYLKDIEAGGGSAANALIVRFYPSTEEETPVLETGLLRANSRSPSVQLTADLTALEAGKTYHVEGSGQSGYMTIENFAVDTDVTMTTYATNLPFTGGFVTSITLFPDRILVNCPYGNDNFASINLLFSERTGEPAHADQTYAEIQAAQKAGKTVLGTDGTSYALIEGSLPAEPLHLETGELSGSSSSATNLSLPADLFALEVGKTYHVTGVGSGRYASATVTGGFGIAVDAEITVTQQITTNFGMTLAYTQPYPNAEVVTGLRLYNDHLYINFDLYADTYSATMSLIFEEIPGEDEPVTCELLKLVANEETGNGGTSITTVSLSAENEVATDSETKWFEGHK